MTITGSNLRTYMELQNATSISDDAFNNAVTDATAILVNTTSDDTAIKFYAAYLLAKALDWKSVSKSGDISFNKQNPETYKDLYDMRMGVLAEESEGNLGMVVYDPKEE